MSKDKEGYACPQGILFNQQQMNGEAIGLPLVSTVITMRGPNFNYSDLIGSIKSNERYVRAVRNIFKKD
jgi:hypothetical protein